MENYMSVKINSYKGRSIRPVYKARIKKDEYTNAIDRICNRYKLGHIKQNESGREYKNRMNKMFSDEAIQSMKKYSHHGRTSLFGHSVHVSYYNYLVCKKLHLDEKAGAKAGLLHDLFLYDWHKYSPGKGERLHGFEHPTKALKNAGKYFDITEKEGDRYLFGSYLSRKTARLSPALLSSPVPTKHLFCSSLKYFIVSLPYLHQTI